MLSKSLGVVIQQLLAQMFSVIINIKI